MPLSSMSRWASKQKISYIWAPDCQVRLLVTNIDATEHAVVGDLQDQWFNQVALGFLLLKRLLLKDYAC